MNEDSTAPYKDRLELAMAEAHHRVKNTLQNIISYINIMFTRKDTVKKEDIQKLIHYIQSLASLHDLLLEQVRSGRDGKMINMDKIVSDIVQIQSLQRNISSGEIPEMLGPPRQAATLSLIVNELFDFFFNFGSTETFIEFEKSSDGIVVMTMREGTTEIGEQDLTEDPPQGLQVAELLAKSDLRSSFEWINKCRPLNVKLKIPIN